MAQPTEELKAALPGLRRTMRHIRPHLRPHRMLVVAGSLALLIEVAFRLLEPWPIKMVIDEVVPATVGDASVPVQALVIAGLAFALFAAGRALFSYLMTVCFALAGNRTMTAVRADVYAHLQRLSLRFHGSSKSGDLLTRLIGDVGRLQEVAVTAALPLVGNVVALLGMSVVMVVIDWSLAIAVISTFPLFALASSSLGSKITSAARLQRRREGDLAGTAAETLGAIKVVQSYTMEPVLQRVFATSNARALTDGVRATRLSAGLERTTDVLVGVVTAIVLFLGGLRVVQDAMTAGDLVIFISYMKGAFKPMRDTAKYTGRLAKAAASGERIVDLLEREPDVDDHPEAVTAPPLRGHVRFESVTVMYSEGDLQAALRNVTLDIPPGTRVGLAGPSGSGKSTLAALVVRLLDPVAGRVRIDGMDLRHVTVESLRQQVAVVLQDSVLFAATALENIRYGRPDASDEEVVRAARKAGAHDFITRLPEGYESVLGERGESLSGGQRQRIAIARAMLRDAPILILDEALTGLDADTAVAVSDAMGRLAAGRTTFVISHDESELDSCDLVVRLEQGRIVSTWARPEPVLADRGGAR